MSKHTPTPWRWAGDDLEAGEYGQLDVMTPSVSCGAFCYGGMVNIGISDEDKDYIVKAVNYHDRLREALREVTATLAWVAHGDCRAIQDDPIMPSAQAQEVANTLLTELDNLEKQQ